MNLVESDLLLQKKDGYQFYKKQWLNCEDLNLDFQIQIVSDPSYFYYILKSL